MPARSRISFRENEVVRFGQTKDGELIGKKGRKVSRAMCRKIEAAGIEYLQITPETLIGKVIAHDIADPKEEQPLVMHNTEITESLLESLDEVNRLQTDADQGVQALRLIAQGQGGRHDFDALRLVLI